MSVPHQDAGVQASLMARREGFVLKGVPGQLGNRLWDYRAKVHSTQQSLWSFCPYSSCTDLESLLLALLFHLRVHFIT